jgi:hypothetical protein
MHGMNNIKCIGYVKYSVSRDVMYLVVQSYSENILSTSYGYQSMGPMWMKFGMVDNVRSYLALLILALVDSRRRST